MLPHSPFEAASRDVCLHSKGPSQNATFEAMVNHMQCACDIIQVPGCFQTQEFAFELEELFYSFKFSKCTIGF